MHRVIATAGQTVQMTDGQLVIDDQPVVQTALAPYPQVFNYEGQNLPRCPQPTPIGETCAIQRLRETLSTPSYDILDLGPSRFDTTARYLVPAGHVFVLGDHRDNSNDSRMPRSAGGIGFVAVSDITGVLHEIRE